jgi:hypothetical protein
MIYLKFKTLLKISYNLFIKSNYINYKIINHKYSEFISVKNFQNQLSNKKIAIVIQGEIIEEDNFTINTILMYKKFFKECNIILSTWKISEKNLYDLKKNKIFVLVNELPLNRGISNINLQIISSINGIQIAKKNGSNYVLKTRTDQRIYNANTFDYLFSLLDLFPLNKSQSVSTRLVGISLNTFKYRLYGLSDMFIFGHITDMENYWSAPLDEREPNTSNLSKRGKTWREFSEWRVCEVYLFTSYMAKLKITIDFTLENYLNFLGDYFIIIDSESVGLFWRKYTFDLERYKQFNIIQPEISFNDWLSFCYFKNERVIDETILDKNCI